MEGMISGALSFVKGHPYLFTNVCSLIICLLTACLLGRPGRLIILGGLLSTPSFYLIALFENEYWNPVRIWGWVVGIEDVLCSFDVGAMALIPCACMFGRRLLWNEGRRTVLLRYFFLGALNSVLFLVLVFMGLGGMTSLVLTYLLMMAILQIVRWRLWPLSVAGLLGFTFIYYVIVRVYFWYWPDFINQWNFGSIWGRPVAGLPLGEIAWAGAFGFFWPLFVGYVLEARLIPQLGSSICSEQSGTVADSRTGVACEEIVLKRAERSRLGFDELSRAETLSLRGLPEDASPSNSKGSLFRK